MPNSVNSQKAAYIATIMSCPCVRLMIFMTPRMSVMPMPMRAYNPPSSNPDTSV